MPNTQSSPYDTAGQVLTTAIVMANDAASSNGIGGSVLNPAQPYVLPMMAERYRYLQQRLITSGVDTCDAYWIIYGLPPAANSNQRVPVILSYNGFFDGIQMWGANPGAPAWASATTYNPYQVVNYQGTTYIAISTAPGANLNQEPDISPLYWAVYAGPVLPSDMRKPLEIWECYSGGNDWRLMRQAADAISTRSISPMFKIWDFKSDKLYLPPATGTNDLKIHGLRMAPDIVSLTSPIVVANCSTALAYLIVAQASRMRGGSKAMEFEALAEKAIQQIVNQTVRKELFSQYVKMPFRGGSRGRFRRAGR